MPAKKRITTDELARMVVDGFEDVTARVDRGFEETDKRFDKIEKRLDAMDAHLSAITERLDTRFLRTTRAARGLLKSA